MVPLFNAKFPSTVWRVAATVNLIRVFAGSNSTVISWARSLSADAPMISKSNPPHSRLFILARGLRPLTLGVLPQSRLKSSRDLTREMIVDILFGWDGHAILGCGSEMPFFQRAEHSFIDRRSQALNH